MALAYHLGLCRSLGHPRKIKLSARPFALLIWLVIRNSHQRNFFEFYLGGSAPGALSPADPRRGQSHLLGGPASCWRSSLLTHSSRLSLPPRFPGSSEGPHLSCRWAYLHFGSFFASSSA